MDIAGGIEAALLELESLTGKRKHGLCHSSTVLSAHTAKNENNAHNPILATGGEKSKSQC